MPILYFFPDTNFFIQCRPFGELDWGRWSDFDEVHLILTRPVRSEIDQHKYRGSDRLAKRARLASSLLREMTFGVTFQRPPDCSRVETLGEAPSRTRPQTRRRT